MVMRDIVPRPVGRSPSGGFGSFALDCKIDFNHCVITMNAIVQEPTRVNAGNAKFGSGKEVRRLEDELLLKGQGQFTDDVHYRVRRT